MFLCNYTTDHSAGITTTTIGLVSMCSIPRAALHTWSELSSDGEVFQADLMIRPSQKKEKASHRILL